MSELPPYLRDADQSPPPSPEAVEGQAGRAIVSPPQESALPVGGPPTPPMAVSPPGARSLQQSEVDLSGRSLQQSKAALPAPGVVAFPPPRETDAAPGTLTPPKEPAVPVTPGPAAGTASVASPEPTKTAQSPVKQQPPQEQPLASTPGAAALPAVQPPASAQFKGEIPRAGFNWLANKQPEVFNTIATVAGRHGVTTERVIQHWRMESDLNLNAPDGAKGEQGPFQILPETQEYLQNKYLNGRQLNPKVLEEGATLAALKIRECDRRGADSYASVACYNGGGDGAKAYAAKFFSDKKSSDYSKFDFGDIDKEHGGSTMTANGAVKAARAGPDQFQRYIVDTSPRGLSMSDAWQHVQGLLLEHFIAKGDMDGAEKAQDFVMRQAFMGANTHLMGAKSSLERGDGITAARQLAKAHAFFPDGTAGRFMTNGTDVFGVRLDEATGKPLGSPFKITSQDIDSQLKFTGNPVTFSKFLSDQQKSAADARYRNAQAGYQEARPAIEADKERGRDARFVRGQEGANARTQARIDAQNQREVNRLAAQEDKDAKPAMTAAQLDSFRTREASDDVWPLPKEMAGTPEEQRYRSQRSQLFTGAKVASPGMSATGEQARLIANGLIEKSFGLVTTPGGYQVVDKQGNLQGTMSMSAGEQFLGKQHPSRQQQGASGAALTPMASGNARPGEPSSVEGVSSPLTQRVMAMYQDMPPEIQRRFDIISGRRTVDQQHKVNPGVTNSRHLRGNALDLAGDPVVLDWINRNGRRYGVGFPLRHMANEQNHLEMVDPRTGQRAPG